MFYSLYFEMDSMKKLLFPIASIILLAGCVTNKESQIMVGDGSNLSMACIQQYEEVSSIRIGCPVDASKLTKLGISDIGMEMYSAKMPDSFF